MSYGILCLTCRRYLTAEQGCKCATPVPSEDGRTPLDRRCRNCGKPSVWMTLCDACDLGSGMAGGTGRPWDEMRELFFARG
jgi:hypothetical protein